MTRLGKKDRIRVLMEPIFEGRWEMMEKEERRIQWQ